MIENCSVLFGVFIHISKWTAYSISSLLSTDYNLAFLQRPLKRRPWNKFSRKSINAGQKYCRMCLFLSGRLRQGSL